MDLDIKNSVNLLENSKGIKRKEYINYLYRAADILVFLLAIGINILLPQKQMVTTSIYRIFLLGFIAVFVLLNIIARFNEKIRNKLNYVSKFYVALGGVIIVWDILTEKSNTLPLPFFPSLAQILQMMLEDYETLIISTFSSMKLLIVGFCIGTVLGIVSGVLIGWYKKWEYWLFPVIKVIGVIPATAWIPIVMFLFPSSFWAQVFLIVLCVWFPVTFMTSSGIQNLPKSYFEAARTLGADEKFLIFKVAIPGAMPSIFTGIYTATGVSFATLVVSEMIGAKAGLGWYINWAKGWSNYAKVYASIIIMAIVFSIVMEIIFKIRDKVLIWQKGLLK